MLVVQRDIKGESDDMITDIPAWFDIFTTARIIIDILHHNEWRSYR